MLADDLDLEEALLAIADRLVLENMQAARGECSLPHLDELVGKLAEVVGELIPLLSKRTLCQQGPHQECQILIKRLRERMAPCPRICNFWEQGTQISSLLWPQHVAAIENHTVSNSQLANSLPDQRGSPV